MNLWSISARDVLAFIARALTFIAHRHKLFLAQSVLVNATLRMTKANQYGLLGFGGPAGNSYRPSVEASFAFLARNNLAIGAEVRSKRGNLRNAALDLTEQAAVDLFVAYFPSKHVSVTAAYVDLGKVVGALTDGRRQSGGYLTLQVGF
jgi:hypothetical protein